jgi:hypothetical protein
MIQNAEMNVPAATAEEPGFEEKGGQHLVRHQRPDDRPRLVGEDRPVGAELVPHDDPRHDAHAESDREDFHPVFEQDQISVVAGFQPKRFEHHQEAREADGERREDEVERNREPELRAG